MRKTKSKVNPALAFTIIIGAALVVGYSSINSAKEVSDLATSDTILNADTTTTSTISPAVTQRTAGWKQYKGGKGFELKHPAAWTAVNSSIPGAVSSVHIESPARYDIPGYEKVGARFVIDLSFSNHKMIEGRQAFMTTSGVDVPLTKAQLQSYFEYKVAQDIMATVRVF